MYLLSGFKAPQELDDTNLFLDRLALLFAGTKASKKAPKNVTATALIYDETCKKSSIYIAKNDGLSKDDKKYLNMLQDWFGLDDEHSTAKESNQYWRALLVHWQNRIRHYREKVKKVPDAMKESQVEVRESLEARTKKFDELKFSKEWKEVLSLIGEVSAIESTNEEVMSVRSAMKCYGFWKRTSRQEYPTISPNNSPVDQYCKCVQHLEMLAMPMSTWKAMCRFRETRYEREINFCFIQRPSSPHLDISQVRPMLTQWLSDDIVNTSIALKNLPGQGQKVYLHCEMQIVLLFYQNRDKPDLRRHDFIGCSKLSCHMCWEVLKDRNFSTRGTHNKISANWAFTFPFKLEGIVDIMKRLKLEWDKLFKDHPNGDFPIWPDRRDTDPAQTGTNKFDKVSHLARKMNCAHSKSLGGGKEMLSRYETQRLPE
jgi:OTT_1508-like deaminase